MQKNDFVTIIEYACAALPKKIYARDLYHSILNGCLFSSQRQYVLAGVHLLILIIEKGEILYIPGPHVLHVKEVQAVA